MESDELISIIDNLVNAKALHLSTWKEVRWQGGRVYYEVKLIEDEIRNFDTKTKIIYLEKLLAKKYLIQDNLPDSAPNVTQDFKNSVLSILSDLKIQFLTSNNRSKQISSKKRRPAIPYKTKTLLQKEVNSKCPFCPNDDVDHFQIHHIDENPENNKFENLIMVCPNCHSKITKGDITSNAVIILKRELSIKIS
jgi:hypothetical protein